MPTLLEAAVTLEAANAALLGATDLRTYARLGDEETRLRTRTWGEELEDANHGEAPVMPARESFLIALRELVRLGNDSPAKAVIDAICAQRMYSVVAITLDEFDGIRPPDPLPNLLGLPRPVSDSLIGRLVDLARETTTLVTEDGMPERQFSTNDLRELTGLENTAIGKYATIANVKKAGRGQRNHRYSLDDVKRILKAVIEQNANASVTEKCKKALSDLGSKRAGR